MDILLPILAIGGMGLIFGAALAIASKIFAVDIDERVPKITEVLPGANCGGCGFAGCNAYADAVVKGKASVNCCPVGGEIAAGKIAAIMGVTAEKTVKKAARVLCQGSLENTDTRYEYDGPMDCLTADRLGGGPKSCSYGCIGLGSCTSVCKFGAIEVNNGVAVVNEEKCTACGACVNICPKNIITILPVSSKVTVKCSSKDKGKKTRTVCQTGCIGCGICAKSCPKEAISLENNVAAINSELCVNCGICANKCPQKCIISTRVVKKAEAPKPTDNNQSNDDTPPKIQVIKKAVKFSGRMQ